MKVQKALAALLCALLCLTGCVGQGEADGNPPSLQNSGQKETETDSVSEPGHTEGPYDVQTSIETVKNDAVFGEYGRLLFPVDNGYMSGNTLGELQFTWYSYMDSDKTVEIVNTLWHRASAGETIFYDIFTEVEKAADPA